MTLVHASLTWEVYYICSSHAYMTENEEIMGVLLGNWNSDHTQVYVWDALCLSRLDRKKDRVEVSSQQLVAASQKAEKISIQTGKETKVVGWYHSHPHITVNPSHVDVKTQWEFQSLDSGFLGLIISVFNKSSNKEYFFEGGGESRVTAFQSIESNDSQTKWCKRDIPFDFYTNQDNEATPLSSSYQRLIELQSIISNEERTSYLESLTSDNVLHLSHCKAIYEQALHELMGVSTLPLLQLLNNELEHWNQKPRDSNNDTTNS